MQIRLKLIYLDFIFMLHYGQRITQVCFSSISVDSDYHNAVFSMFVESKKGLNFCCLFLPIYVPYHLTFYSVVEIPTLPEVVFYSLMLYNDVSILYVLSGEFS